MSEEMVDVVDENDEFVKKATREDIEKNRLLHRLSRVIILNKEGKILVHKRAKGKLLRAGWWDVGVAETLESGESYESAAVRGLSEELGIAGISKEQIGNSFLSKIRHESETSNVICKVYEIVYDGKIAPNQSEVEEFRFLSEKEIEQFIEDGILTPGGTTLFMKYMQINSQEMVDIVDEEDNVVGKATRMQATQNHLFHRTSFVIIMDLFKRFLIQKRSASKKIFPGCWDLGAAETVVRGESYENAAIRALEEELGIKGYTEKELTFLFGIKFRSDSYNTNTKVFRLVFSGTVTIQTDEVDEARNASASEIRELISSGVFAPDGALIFNKYTGDSNGRNG